MDSLGTITMYYQFLDKGCVEILDEIMKGANDYCDFAERLVEYVCAQEVPIMLAYLAAVHVWNTGYLEPLRKMRSKFGDIAYIRVWIGKSEYDNRMVARKEALSQELDDWMKAGICYVISRSPDYYPVLQVQEYVMEGLSLTERNPQLEFFMAYLLEINARIKQQEGDTKSGIGCLKEALSIARKYDDQYQSVVLLLALGNITRNTNVNASWNYCEEAHRVAESIGHHQGTQAAIFEMGKVALVRGEYDLSVKCFDKTRQIAESTGLYLGTAFALNYARVLSSMGDGAGALSWAESSLERDGGSPYSMLEKAHALIIMGKLGDATEQINLAQVKVLKDGREWTLGIAKYVGGLLELAEGRFLEGMSTLEGALEILDRLNLDLLAVPCLIALARAEVDSYEIGGDIDMPGPWLEQLEQRARDRDYPGILMEHALLKAQFHMKEDAADAARKALTEALNILDSPSVKTLRDRILGRIQEISPI